MAGIFPTVLLNIIAAITNTLDNGDVVTNIKHRVFFLTPQRMMSTEWYAKARVTDVMTWFPLPMDEKVCARIMHIIRVVRHSRFYEEIGCHPYTTLYVSLDHGEITSIVSEFDDEIVLSIEQIDEDDQTNMKTK